MLRADGAVQPRVQLQQQRRGGRRPAPRRGRRAHSARHAHHPHHADNTHVAHRARGYQRGTCYKRRARYTTF